MFEKTCTDAPEQFTAGRTCVDLSPPLSADQILVADLSVALELDGSSDSPASLDAALAVFYVR